MEVVASRFFSHSTWCIVEYDGRFGFDTISILELKGSGFVQTDIGKQIDKSLEAAIAKQSHDPESSGGDATPHFRIGANRKVRVGTVSTTDPKQLNDRDGPGAISPLRSINLHLPKRLGAN
jgi:hypothetical protein